MSQSPLDWTYRIRLRNLQVLLSLAKTQNLSHSALALHATQPTLSKWLKELETDVGVPLFERHSRGLKPTVYGEALISHALRIDAHLSNARDDLASMVRGGGGVVRIGSSGASTANTVPNAVLHLMRSMPQVRIKVSTGTMDDLMQQLDSGQLDIVVGGSADMLPSGLRSEPLYEESLHFVVRPKHPLLKKRRISWNDLVAYPWLLWPQGTPIRNALDAAISADGRKPPSQVVESNSVTVNMALLNGSDLIGIASERAARRFAQLKVMASLPLTLPRAGSVVLWWREDAVERPAVALALDAIRRASSGLEATSLAEESDDLR